MSAVIDRKVLIEMLEDLRTYIDRDDITTTCSATWQKFLEEQAAHGEAVGNLIYDLQENEVVLVC